MKLFSIFVFAFLFIFSLTEGKPHNDNKHVPRPPTPPAADYVPSTTPGQILNPDIKLSLEQIQSGANGEHYRWRGGMYMQISSAFNEQERVLINNALFELHSNLCIDILLWPSDANPSGDYVFIERGGGGSGCWSYVGKQGGRQVLNLEAPGCVHHGVTIHEAIHAVGFFHEQSRPDRDNYVNVHWENIIPDMRYNFDILHDTITFDVPYDYTSIMHYSNRDFSSNGQITLSAKNGQDLGSKYALTELDRIKLNRMYPGC